MGERKGIGGHQSAAASTTTWLTPPPIIRALGGAESFDLDPCAFPGWPTAATGYTLHDPGENAAAYEVGDGLALPWFGRVWLNPPYTSGEIADWLAKLADHGRGTALIFARSETEAFQSQVFERASGLLWLAGRLHFHDANGVRAKANAGAPSVLCAYGQEDLDRLAASDLPGTLTPLRFPRFMAVLAVGNGVTGATMPALWREIVLDYARQHGGAVNLSDLYRAVARHPRAKASKHWRAKVRQTLQRAGARRVGPGQWEAPDAQA